VRSRLAMSTEARWSKDYLLYASLSELGYTTLVSLIVWGYYLLLVEKRRRFIGMRAGQSAHVKSRESQKHGQYVN
jgi:hypothetical protein